MKGFIDLVVEGWREKTLGKALKRRLYPLAYFPILSLRPSLRKIRIHCPAFDSSFPSDPCRRNILERIFVSYRAMKQAEGASTGLAPSSMWQAIIDDAYAPLIEGLNTGDLKSFHYFLANFGVWNKNHGVENNILIREAAASRVKGMWLKHQFAHALKIWKWFYGGRKDPAALVYPQFGNQSGALIDGMFVGYGSFFNEVYGSILSGLVKDRARPVVADLGAGYGKLAYFILRDLPSFAFLAFDLPETICLAAYYLMNVWPQKKTLLYGEAPLDQQAIREHDLLFMPGWEIEKLGDGDVDLFVNKNSLGEMNRETVKRYIGHICRATRFFFHMNHDIYTVPFANERSVLGVEYPVPDDRFRLLFRYPDIGHLLMSGYLEMRNDIFCYLYERMK